MWNAVFLTVITNSQISKLISAVETSSRQDLWKTFYNGTHTEGVWY